MPIVQGNWVQQLLGGAQQDPNAAANALNAMLDFQRGIQQDQLGFAGGLAGQQHADYRAGIGPQWQYRTEAMTQPHQDYRAVMPGHLSNLAALTGLGMKLARYDQTMPLLAQLLAGGNRLGGFTTNTGQSMSLGGGGGGPAPMAANPLRPSPMRLRPNTN